MMAAALWLASQAPAVRPATVGDTVWVSTRVPLAARQILRAQTWDLGEVGQVLGPPEVDYDRDSALVRYPVAFWFAGAHAVSVPGPIVVSPEGRSDTLAARSVVVSIATLLPPTVPRDSLTPRDPAGLMPQAERSLLPVVVLSLLAGITAGFIAWVRQRRNRRSPPEPALVQAERPAIHRTLIEWGRAGEIRAAAEGWSQLIQARQAASPADQTGAAIAAALDEVGFQPGALPPRVEQLLGQAAAWVAARTATA